MNFLPILLIIFLLYKNKNATLVELLNNVDIDGLSPLLEIFGVDKTILETISNKEFKDFISGNGSFKALLPLLPTLLKSFNNFNNGKNYTSEESSAYYEEAQNLTPIKDIASEKIMSTLGNYFNT
jgi:hypothetical protein